MRNVMTKVAVIQMVSNDNLQDNLHTAAMLIQQGAEEGVRLALLPENFALMGKAEEDKIHIAEELGTGLIQTFLSEIAKKYRIWLIGGTIPIKAENSPKVFSSCLIYDDEGRRLARYD